MHLRSPRSRRVLQLDVSGRPQADLPKRPLSPTPAMVWPGRWATLLHAARRRGSCRQGCRAASGCIAIAVRGGDPGKDLAPDAGAVQPKLYARATARSAPTVATTCTSTDWTRGHIVPISRGGLDSWMNCITACLLRGRKATACRGGPRACFHRFMRSRRSCAASVGRPDESCSPACAHQPPACLDRAHPGAELPGGALPVGRGHARRRFAHQTPGVLRELLPPRFGRLAPPPTPTSGRLTRASRR